MSAFAVPARFSDAVILHLLRCFTMDPNFGTAQILLITGAPGSGKTFQLRHTLVAAGVEIVEFDAGDVESPSANEPIRRLQSCTTRVRENLDKKIPSALVIDDAHLLLGRMGQTQYTHNLQRIIAELMKTATAVNLQSGVAVATPIILIANHSDYFNEAMVRHGRARHLHWCPSHDELSSIVHNIFPLMRDPAIRSLLECFVAEDVSFFAALQDAMIDKYLQDWMSSRHGYDVALRASLADRDQLRPAYDYTVEDLIRVGARLRAERENSEIVAGVDVIRQQANRSEFDGKLHDAALGSGRLAVD